jgi:hypothetical protein
MFNFNFGKKKPDKKQIIIVSIVLSVVVAILSQCSGAPQERLWDLLDEVQRRLFPQTIINDVLLQDPGVVERRVKRDVDKAIRDYEMLTGDTGEVRIPLPSLIEAPLDTLKYYTEECKKLGGEMRLCSPWLMTALKTRYINISYFYRDYYVCIPRTTECD